MQDVNRTRWISYGVSLYPLFSHPVLENTPVSKCLIVGSTVGSLIAHVFNWKSALSLRVFPELLPKFQLWRLFTSPFIFSGGGSAVISLFLLYSFRSFERLMGSRKYAVRGNSLAVEGLTDVLR